MPRSRPPAPAKDWFRERQLRGSARAGSWARDEARRNQLSYLHRNWRPFLIFLVSTYALAGMVAAFLRDDLMRGFVLGAATFGTPGLLWGLLLQLSGTAPVLMGVTAEQWTADELKRLPRSGWKVIHHFALNHGDIDHLLLGPGGLYCIETKWSASPWHDQWGRDRQDAAARQVQDSARRVTNWHPARSQGLRAQPVVVLWGGALSVSDETPANWERGGVPIVAGHSMQQWVERLPARGVSELQIKGLWDAVKRQAETRDRHDAAATYRPPSVYAVLMTAIATVAVGVLPNLLVYGVASLTNSVWWVVLTPVVSALAMLPWVRRGRLRWPARGWVVGALLCLVWIAITLLRQ